MNYIVNSICGALSMTMLLGAGVASAQSLNEIGAACRSGNFDACSTYNAAIIRAHAAERPVLLQGYDPFGIVPATHQTREPTLPVKEIAGTTSAAKASPDQSQ